MKEIDPSIQQSFIKFKDANDLYGSAMSQILPTGNFKWVSSIACNAPQITHGIEGTTHTEEEVNKSTDEYRQDILTVSIYLTL